MDQADQYRCPECGDNMLGDMSNIGSPRVPALRKRARPRACSGGRARRGYEIPIELDGIELAELDLAALERRFGEAHSPLDSGHAPTGGSA